MSEELLREELRRLVEPIRPSETAYQRVLERRDASRRRGRLVAATTVAVAASVAASVVLLGWLPGHRSALPGPGSSASTATGPATLTSPPPPSPSTSSQESQLAFARGVPPKLPIVVGRELIRPVVGGQSTKRLDYPDWTSVQLFQSNAGIVVNDRSARGVYVVEETGERQLVRKVPLGVAVDATRLAYAVQVVKKGVVTSDLHLIDIASGREIQTFRGAPNASPTLFDGDRVILSVGDGAEFGTGYWNLSDNSYSLWPNGAGTLPVSVAGSVALIKGGDGECYAIVTLPSMRRSVKPCPGDRGQRFVALAPDGKRFAGVGYTLDEPTAGWPVIANTAGVSMDERFHQMFVSAGLTVDAYQGMQVAWEDTTHVLVVAAKQGTRMLVRCDVVAGSCEIAKDDVPASVGGGVLLIAR